ncbi:MAG: TRAP transporter small permease subunit [Azospirillaceae bacterium]
MQGLLKFSDGLAAIVIRIGKLAAWLAVLLIVVILYDVITRSIKSSSWIADVPWLLDFFNTVDPYISSTKLQELEWHIHGVLLLLCFGYAYVKDAHVRIELLRDRFSMKLRAWVEIVGIVVGLFFYCYVVIAYGTEFAIRSFERGEGSSAMTGLSDRWIIKSFLPIGFTVLAMAGLSVMIKCLVYLFGPPHLQDEAGDYFRPKGLLEDEAETLDEAVIDVTSGAAGQSR